MASENKPVSVRDHVFIPEAADWRFGIVVSEWNGEITEALYGGAVEALTKCGVRKQNIERVNVPGSYELIFGARLLAERKAPDAIICIGSVIRGETAHFDHVCSAVTQGIKDLNIQLDIPVIFGVLTDDHVEQSRARSGGKYGNKGSEAAIAAVKMVALKREHPSSGEG